MINYIEIHRKEIFKEHEKRRYQLRCGIFPLVQKKLLPTLLRGRLIEDESCIFITAVTKFQGFYFLFFFTTRAENKKLPYSAETRP